MNRAIPAYTLEQVIDLSRTTITSYRRGEANLGNMSIDKAKNLQEYINNHYQISFDYGDLIKELESDFLLLDDLIFVARKQDELNTKIIVDYSSIDNAQQMLLENLKFVESETLMFTFEKKEEVLKEMKRVNKIL